MSETKETKKGQKRQLEEHDQQPVQKEKATKCRKTTKNIDEVFISDIAKQIGNNWSKIGINLGYREKKLEQLEQIYPKEPVWRNHVMLVKWLEIAKQFVDEENIRKMLAKCIYEAEDKLLADTISDDYESIERQKEIDNGIQDIVFDINEGIGIKEAQRRSTLEAWRKRDELFYETRAYHETKQTLDKKGYVTVVGPPGDGKTSIIIHLALQCKENGYDIFPLKDITEINQYCDPRKKRLLVIDDIIGMAPASVTMVEAEKIRKESKTIIDCVTNGQIKFVATLRNSILQQCMLQLSKTLVGESIVDVSSTNLRLNHQERRTILKRYSQHIPKNTIHELQVSDYFPGFPLLCHFFANGTNISTRNACSRFDPRIVLRRQIEEMEKHNQLGYCVLVLTAMADGCFEPDNLDDIIDPNPPNTELVQNMKIWIETCGLKNNLKVVQDLKQNFHNQRNVYLTEDNDLFSFLHDYVFDAVACHHGKKTLKFVLKYCSTWFVRNRVRIDNVDGNMGIICIPETKYRLLAERLIIDMKNGKIYNVFSNPVVTNKDFQTVFFKVLSRDDIADLTEMLIKLPKNESKKYDVGISLDVAVFESTSVHWLCRLGCLDLLKQLLLQIKVCPGEFFASLPGHTQPLHFAAGYGHLEVVKYLLEQKVDVNAKSSLEKVDPSIGEFYTGFTPLFYAARQNFTEVVECLLQNGAEPNIVREHGASPMLLAADKGHSEVIKLLLQYGADPNLCCEHGTSPLFLAAQEDHTDAVVALIDGKANINQQKPNGFTPLSIAAKKGNSRTVECLLKREANPDLLDKERRNTALHQTVLMGHVETARILLKSNANKEIENSDGKTAFALAQELGNSEIINLFAL